MTKTAQAGASVRDSEDRTTTSDSFPSPSDNHAGMNPADFDLLKEPDVMALLSVSRPTLARWRQNGTGPRFVKLGRGVWYPRGAIVQWIRAHEARSSAEYRERARKGQLGSEIAS